MSWKDLDSPWVRAMRKKRFAKEPLPAPTAYCTIGFTTTLAIGMIAWGLFDDLILMLLFGYFIFAGSAILAVYTYYGSLANKQRTLLWQLVPDNDGRVCPHCWEILEQSENQCSFCKTKYDLLKLKTYWLQFPFDARTAYSYLEQAADKTYEEIKILGKIPAKPPQKQLGKLGWSILSIFIVFPLILQVLYPASFIAYLMNKMGHICFLAAGMILKGRQEHRRDDTSVFCAVCDYQQAPDSSQPDNCPECGNTWLEDGHNVLGEKIDLHW